MPWRNQFLRCDHHVETGEELAADREASFDFYLDLVDARAGSVEIVGRGDDDVRPFVHGVVPIAQVAAVT